MISSAPMKRRFGSLRHSTSIRIIASAMRSVWRSPRCPSAWRVRFLAVHSARLWPSGSIAEGVGQAVKEGAWDFHEVVVLGGCHNILRFPKAPANRRHGIAEGEIRLGVPARLARNWNGPSKKV